MNGNNNIIIMGKTGSGKSTLINSVYKSDVAPTGIGQRVTKKDKLYSKPVSVRDYTKNESRQVSKIISITDTVGLEISSAETEQTLSDIRKRLDETQENYSIEDVNIVWFCINSSCSRFEQYEVSLIEDLKYKYEIPFIIVLTQCLSDEKVEIEQQINQDFPDNVICRVLAKSKKTNIGEISPFGVDELLSRSIFDYNELKTKVLESKSNVLGAKCKDVEKRINKLIIKADECVKKHSRSALHIGWIPGVCIPVIQGICFSMINDLNRLLGVRMPKGFAADVAADIAVGIIVTPLMALPLLSAAVATSYVKLIGEEYRDILISVVKQSSDSEIKDMELMSKRITNEIKMRKANKT